MAVCGAARRGAEAGVGIDAAEVDECAAALDALHAAGARHALRASPAKPRRRGAGRRSGRVRRALLRPAARRGRDAEAEACGATACGWRAGATASCMARWWRRVRRAVWFEHGGGAAAWHAPCAPTGGEPKYTLTVFKAPRRA